MSPLLDQTRIPLDLSQYRTPVMRWRWFLDRWWWCWQRLIWWLECLLRLWRRLPFTMQAQLQTQCSVVNAELGQTTCCQNGSTAQCNQPWYLNLALTRTGNLASWSAGTATIAQIRSQIRTGRTLGARIGWSGGGGHFVMIAGY